MDKNHILTHQAYMMPREPKLGLRNLLYLWQVMDSKERLISTMIKVSYWSSLRYHTLKYQTNDMLAGVITFHNVLVDGAVRNQSTVPVAVKYRPFASRWPKFTATDHAHFTVINFCCKHRQPDQHFLIVTPTHKLRRLINVPNF